MTEQRVVECPSCHHRQAEPETVVGTICQSCRESFAVPPGPPTSEARGIGALSRTLGGIAREQWSTFFRRWRAQTPSTRLGRGRLVATPFTIVDAPDPAAANPAGTRRVACPHCQAPARLPVSALTHCCTECGRHYQLEDHAISGEVHANLATAGRVIVHHGACLEAAWVRCGELIVHGQAAGAFTVTGRAEYHGSGEAVGELHCGHLVVCRGAHRVFYQRVFALTADIHGEITGDVCCATRLRVSRGGAVHGAVLAGQMAIDAGGRVNGSMATLRAVHQPGARLTQTARDLLSDFGQ